MYETLHPLSHTHPEYDKYKLSKHQAWGGPSQGHHHSFKNNRVWPQKLTHMYETTDEF